MASAQTLAALLLSSVGSNTAIAAAEEIPGTVTAAVSSVIIGAAGIVNPNITPVQNTVKALPSASPSCFAACEFDTPLALTAVMAGANICTAELFAGKLNGMS
jgi:hypothetical protein